MYREIIYCWFWGIATLDMCIHYTYHHFMHSGIKYSPKFPQVIRFPGMPLFGACPNVMSSPPTSLSQWRLGGRRIWPTLTLAILWDQSVSGMEIMHEFPTYPEKKHTFSSADHTWVYSLSVVLCNYIIYIYITVARITLLKRVIEHAYNMIIQIVTRWYTPSERSSQQNCINLSTSACALLAEAAIRGSWAIRATCNTSQVVVGDSINGMRTIEN